MNKKIIYYLILTFLTFNITLRYPTVNFQQGGLSDSWDYHMQINQLLSEGASDWIFNIRSYYGFYPPYLEVGMVNIYSSFITVTGLSVTHSVLFLSGFLGVFSFFSSLLLFIKLLDNSYTAIFAAALFSTAPDIVDSTSWNLQSRYLLTIFSFLILFVYLKVFDNIQPLRYLFILLIFLISLSSIHRSSIVLISSLLILTSLIFIDRFYGAFNSARMLSMKNYILTFFILIFSFLFLFNLNAESGSFSGIFFTWIMTKSMDFGFALIFIPFSIISVYKIKLKKELLFPLFLLVYISLDPFSKFIYNSLDALIFILLGIGLKFVFSEIKNFKLALPIFLALVLVIGSLPKVLTIREVEVSEGSDTNSDFSASFYLKENMEVYDNMLLFDKNTSNEKIRALTGVKKYNDLSIKNIELTIYEFDIFQMLEDKEGHISLYGLDRKTSSLDFLKSDFDSGEAENFITENKYIFLVSNPHSNDTGSKYSYYYNLIIQVKNESYLYYANENVVIYPLLI